MGMWLMEYIPKNYDNKNVIELLLSQLCLMGLCCVISGTFPAFTAEMINSYNIITLCIAITDSIILDHILGRNGREPNFTIGSFVFSFGEDDLGDYTGCLKKSFTTLKAYRNLYRGHTQRFELSKCSKTHRVLPRIVIRNSFDLFSIPSLRYLSKL